jgi:YHS domain-containing protein
MSNPKAIVERYLGALYGGDSGTARQCLADDVSFQGPAAKFSGADAYMKASAHAVHAVKRLETHKVFVDGPDVAVFYDMYLDHPVGSVTIGDWYHIEGDKIAAIRTILDTGPFTAPVAGETAVDPVCGMTVNKASAATSRTADGVTYYFCSTGCAEAFDRERISTITRSA